MPPLPQPFKTAPRRVHRKHRSAVTSSGPAALTLVSASFSIAGPRVTMQFDRAIDIAALDGSEVFVDGGDTTTFTYLATGAAHLVDPQTVQIICVEDGPSPGVQSLLTASATTGIVAVDDGGTWAGVTDLELPFNA